jgi:AcrR family transcriptional regulator
MSKITKPQPSASERILAAASELFYREGYRAVGIDRIIERAGVAKASLYRSFPTKDDLIAAYLERADADFWRWFDDAISSTSPPREQLVALFGALEKLATTPACLGCTFQAAASEFPEPNHPGHEVAREHKLEVMRRLRDLAQQAGADDPGTLAEELMLIMDGAFAAARMHGPNNQARSTGAAARALLDARIPP